MRKLRAGILPAVVFGLLFTGFGLCGANEVLKDPTTGRPVRYGGRFETRRTVSVPPYLQRAREMRGVWVATVENIDFGRHTDAAGFKRDFIAVVNNLQRAKFNAIFFQVRPMCDAFYPSKHNPWSRWMTGKDDRDR